MKLFYVLDYIFRQTPDGRIWTDTSYDASFWDPYLEVYSEVAVVSRVMCVKIAHADWNEVEGHNVSVCAVPIYRSAIEYALKSRMLQQVLRRIFAGEGAVVLRMPSNLARCAAAVLDRMGRAYAVEVVGDPHAALARGVVQMAGRPLFRHIFTQAQRSVCRKAIGVAYVAQGLRTVYPESSGAASLVCSDVRLDRSWLGCDLSREQASKPLRILTVATLSQTYKGIDVLLKAMQLCLQHSVDYTLTIVGTGRYQRQLERAANDFGISHAVTFLGAVPWGPELIAQFDAHDLFVLPSRVEVMPRALLEAMSRGLPAIATDVGAVGEILRRLDIITPGDPWHLAERMLDYAADPSLLSEASARNRDRAKAFSSDALLPRWQAFHRQLQVRFQSRGNTAQAMTQIAVA